MQTTIQVTATAHTTAFTFTEQALRGEVLFHSVRGDGSLRRIRLLQPETEEYETAEWVLEQREAKVPMRTIARQMHLAVPSVRRLINRYLLTEEVLEADGDELAELSSTANAGLDDLPTVSPAPELEAALRAAQAEHSAAQPVAA